MAKMQPMIYASLIAVMIYDFRTLSEQWTLSIPFNKVNLGRNTVELW